MPFSAEMHNVKGFQQCRQAVPQAVIQLYCAQRAAHLQQYGLFPVKAAGGKPLFPAAREQFSADGRACVDAAPLWDVFQRFGKGRTDDLC